MIWRACRARGLHGRVGGCPYVCGRFSAPHLSREIPPLSCHALVERNQIIIESDGEADGNARTATTATPENYESISDETPAGNERELFITSLWLQMTSHLRHTPVLRHPHSLSRGR